MPFLRSPLEPSTLDPRFFKIAVVILLVFGLVSELLLVMGVNMANRVLDRGVAPMQELLVMQRHLAQARHVVESHEHQFRIQCSVQEQDEICQLKTLLQSTIESSQRLLLGSGGLAGIPLSTELTGQAKTAVLDIRDRATKLLHKSINQEYFNTADLLDLQKGFLQISTDIQRLEHLLLMRLNDDFRTKHRLDMMALGATGTLLLATMFALFWMWWNVRASFCQVNANKARLRAYADAAPDPAFVLNDQGAMVDFIGKQKQEHNACPLGMSVGERIQDNHAEDLASVYLAVIERALDTQSVQTVEAAVQDAKGQERWFESRVAAIDTSALFDHQISSRSEKQHGEVIWISREITHRIQTEQALRQLNEQLEQRVNERTNALDEAMSELRRFNYTVSHDLRAPLRAVEAFISLAVDEAGDSLNASTRVMLERARKSTHQLEQMVESLLNLSRIGEMPLQNCTLDITAMANDICQELQVCQGAHRLQFQVEPGLKAWADEHLMRSLLQNLINNAVKYSSHREPALICIGSSKQADGTVAIYVQDNGAGFDMARSGQLFQPFTRLHSKREFVGDGIGLATVRRIVTRHGGRVWAQGQVDVGATFYFTLPTEPPRERVRDFSASQPPSVLLTVTT